MRYNLLGSSDLKISELCLGSMTWGTQNSEHEAFAQIDMALDHGVNIIDTAELYPANPMSAATQGDTQRIIGNWIAQSGKRDKVIIATKVGGIGYMPLRNGAPISPKTITMAMDEALKNLKTNYIDLYQLHWPNRGGYMFRRNWDYDPTSQDTTAVIDNMLEVLKCLQDFMNAGKIRYIGVSNETAWGTTQWVHLAKRHSLARMISIQNEYSLLHRLFDTDLAEVCHHERIGLLCYSPLAAGYLTGKYRHGAIPKGSRMMFSPDLGGRAKARAAIAVDAYHAIAHHHGLDPVQMALAWCCTRSFMDSVIIGATTPEQLKNSLQASELALSHNLLNDITIAHKNHPMPY